MRELVRALGLVLSLGMLSGGLVARAQDAPVETPPVEAPPGEAPAETPAETTPPGPPDLRYAHAEVGAYGSIDIAAIRTHPAFGELITHTLSRYGVSPLASAAVVRMLGHTHSISGTLAYGPGDSAVLATLLLRGEYGPTEVPDAFHDVLPTMARGLWYPTRIDGRRAFDLGAAALVEVEPGAWLISRRIAGNLALGSRDRVPGALREEVIEASALLAPSTGFGALVGPRATIPGNDPPGTLEQIFRGPAHASSALRFEGGRAVVELYVTLHHRSDAARWAEAYRSILGSLAADLGVPSEAVTHRIELAGVVLHAHVELDPSAVDAFVARLVGGRLLTHPPTPPAAPSEG